MHEVMSPDETTAPMAIHVYGHAVTYGDGRVFCHSYVTSGLKTFGQKEIVLTVKINERGPRDEPHGSAFALLRAIKKKAQEGVLVDAGGITTLRPPAFLGRQGLVFCPSAFMDGVQSGCAYLMGILLTDEELAVAESCGYLRVLACLGQEYRYFPYPPWSDLQRLPLPMRDRIEKSILTRMPRLPMSTTASCSRVGNRVLLQLRPGSARVFAGALSELSGAPFAILPGMDSSADSCLVWNPLLGAPSDIRPHGSKSDRTAGCFLSIGPGASRNAGGIFEDGYAFSFTSYTWRSVRESLESGHDLEVRSDDVDRPLGLAVLWLSSDDVQHV